MAERESPYRVYYCPGMMGEIRADRQFLRGLAEGGVGDSVLFNWPRYLNPLRNLRNRVQHHRAAGQLMETVRRFQRSSPDRPVVLMGHSTGTLVLLEALTLMEEGGVEQAWLLASAVRPGYDVRPALQRLDRLVNVYSRKDRWLAGWGTFFFGTADGAREPAAGKVGLVGPGADDPRVEQLAYESAWREHGHRGGHLGVLSREFAGHVIAPAILRHAPEPVKP